MKYMWNEEFPRTILLIILQFKLNIGSNVDLNKGAEITEPTHVGIEGDQNVPIHIKHGVEGIIKPEENTTPVMTDLLGLDIKNLTLDVMGMIGAGIRIKC